MLHVVLLRPRRDLTAIDRTAILDGLTSSASGIPSVRRLRIGRRVRHGREGYEQTMTADYEYTVIIEFDDLDGLISYLTHPLHAALGEHFTSSSSAALAYDYEIVKEIAK